MKKKIICTLLTLGLISNLTLSTICSANASEINTTEVSAIQPRTSYDWYVYNLGVSSQSSSQIKGPMTGGSFNTEGTFGSNRTFKISWKGAASNASFYFYAKGADSGNSGSINSSSNCSGSSGSTTITIPSSDAGIVKIYVSNSTKTAINFSEIHVVS